MHKNVKTVVLCLSIGLIGPAMLTAQANRPQAEKITNGPVVEGTGTSYAEVAWTTNEGGSTVVHYGTNPSQLTQTAQAPYADNEKTQSQNHRVRIGNLQPGTTYYFRVDSGQGEGTGSDAMSPVGQFTTKGAASGGGAANGGGQSERITHAAVVEKAGATSAVIAWSTNTGGSSVVRYGTSPSSLNEMAESPYAKDASSTSGETHRVTLRNLQPNTTYYYQVDSGQGQGTNTEAKGSVQSFKTAAR